MTTFFKIGCWGEYDWLKLNPKNDSFTIQTCKKKSQIPINGILSYKISSWYVFTWYDAIIFCNLIGQFLGANINKFKNFHLIGWRLINIPLKCTTDRSHVGPPLNISITKFVFVHVQVRHWILQSDWMTTYFSVYTRATDISNFFFIL